MLQILVMYSLVCLDPAIMSEKNLKIIRLQILSLIEV